MQVGQKVSILLMLAVGTKWVAAVVAMMAMVAAARIRARVQVGATGIGIPMVVGMAMANLESMLPDQVLGAAAAAGVLLLLDRMSAGGQQHQQQQLELMDPVAAVVVVQARDLSALHVITEKAAAIMTRVAAAAGVPMPAGPDMAILAKEVPAVATGLQAGVTGDSWRFQPWHPHRGGGCGQLRSSRVHARG